MLIQLYVDNKTELAKSEIVKTDNGKILNTIAKKWSELQASKFKANSQQFYVILDQNTETLLIEPNGADYEISSHLKFLNKGLSVFNDKHSID